MTTDGGKTFVPVKGAPGGDDYHQLWVNPKDGNRMVLSSDQGTVVSVDGGKTWSTWYNQPTAQLYHVAADNRFPYWLYGAQQDSGGVGVSTWSREGVLSFRNWEPTCLAGESDTVVPDPKDGNILYGGGAGAAIRPSTPPHRWRATAGRRTWRSYRRTWTLPEVFSLADEALYYSNQFVFRTRDRGTQMGEDQPRSGAPAPGRAFESRSRDRQRYRPGYDRPLRCGLQHRSSPLEAATVWVGTDDGLIYVTRDDGKTGSTSRRRP